MKEKSNNKQEVLERQNKALREALRRFVDLVITGKILAKNEDRKALIDATADANDALRLLTPPCLFFGKRVRMK